MIIHYLLNTRFGDSPDQSIFTVQISAFSMLQLPSSIDAPSIYSTLPSTIFHQQKTASQPSQHIIKLLALRTILHRAIEFPISTLRNCSTLSPIMSQAPRRDSRLTIGHIAPQSQSQFTHQDSAQPAHASSSHQPPPWKGKAPKEKTFGGANLTKEEADREKIFVQGEQARLKEVNNRFHEEQAILRSQQSEIDYNNSQRKKSQGKPKGSS